MTGRFVSRGHWWVTALALGLVLAAAPRRASAQGPTIDTGTPGGPGTNASSLGSAPGAGDSTLGTAPGSGGSASGGQDQGPISGRLGPSVSRAPASVSQGGGGLGLPQQPGIAAPTAPPITEVPVYGTLAFAVGPEDQGPLHGLTLDMAIERLVRENLDLKSRYFELPQADADILTASLRANPVFYADAQLVPYGQYSIARPGGQTQYDVNISYPLDVSRKRRARTVSAVRARRVLDAQYQNAVRLQIDNLYGAWVDVLASRQRVRFAEASLKGTTEVYQTTRELLKIGGEKTRAEVSRVEIQRDKAAIGVEDAKAELSKRKRTLAAMLNIPPHEAEAMEIRGTIYDRVPPPPLGDELVNIALNNRADLTSYRLGIQRAEADVRLAKANRLQDLYLLYQPYTFQNNQPFGLKSPTSWALGITVPMPVYNRNQGVIQRAQLNVTQTQSETAALERQIITEVQQAEKEYLVSRDFVTRAQQLLLPRAEQVLRDSYRLYREGEQNVIYYLEAQREYNETAQQYLDTVVRHRNSMLDLNTAVGARLLP